MNTPTHTAAPPTASVASPNKSVPNKPAPASPNPTDDLLDQTEPAVWWKRWTTWLALFCALALVAGGVWWQMARKRAAEPSYTTELVATGDITRTVTANGSLQPTRSINIGSELSGTVLKVNVDVNDRIKRGQVLVVLDTAKLRDQVLRAQASVASAQAQAAQKQATVAESQASLARLEAVAVVSGGQVPSLLELDAARAAQARAVADQDAAKAGVRDAQAALSTEQTNLGKASITAPADGVVLTRNVDPGNAVAAALQAVTLFTVAEDLGRLRLWVYVDEADVGAVAVGQNASFTVSAYPSRQYPARITRVGFGSTITDKVVTYLTYLDVDNTDLSLRPGMSASAGIVASQRQGVLLVPNAALRYTPSAAANSADKGIASGIAFGPPKTESRRQGAADSASTAGAKQVWVLPQAASGAQAVPVAVAVTAGISDGHMTEITAGELKAGMRVITGQKTAAP